MNKKIFTLIHGDKILVSPKEKIISAKELSTLQQAGEVLEHIREDAEKFRLEVAKDSEKIKEIAFKEGY